MREYGGRKKNTIQRYGVVKSVPMVMKETVSTLTAHLHTLGMCRRIWPKSKASMLPWGWYWRVDSHFGRVGRRADMLLLTLQKGEQAWGCPVAVCRPGLTHRAHFGVMLDLWSQLMRARGGAPRHRFLAALVWREVHIVRFVCLWVCAA